MIWLGIRTRIGTRRMRSNAFLEIVLPLEYLAAQNKDALAERLQPLFGHGLGDTPSIAMLQLKALRNFDAGGRLKEFRGIPTLVVSAEYDIIFPPACGMALAAGINGAKYVEIPGAAHGVTIQCYETVNRLLHEHFNSAGAFMSLADCESAVSCYSRVRARYRSILPDIHVVDCQEKTHLW